MNQLPKENKNDYSEEEALLAFKREILNEKLFINQKEDRKDYGIDVEIEAKKTLNNIKYPANIRIQVQLKGTDKKLNKDNSLSFGIYSKNINYLFQNTNGIYICYHIKSKTLFVKNCNEIVEELYNELEIKRLLIYHLSTVYFIFIFWEIYCNSCCRASFSANNSRMFNSSG